MKRETPATQLGPRLLRLIPLLAALLSAPLLACDPSKVPPTALDDIVLSPESANCGLSYRLIASGEPARGTTTAFRSADVLTPADGNGTRDRVTLGVQGASLEGRDHVTLNLIDPLRCLVVRELEALPEDDAGRFAVTWDGSGADGQLVPPGGYYVASHPDLGIDAQQVVVGERDFLCDLPDQDRQTVKERIELDAESGPVELEVPFEVTERSELCITTEIPPAGEGGERPEFTLTLDGEEVLADADVPGPGEVTVAAIRNDGTGLAKLLLQKGIVVIGIDLIPDPPPTPLPPIVRNDINCTGRALGFEHPLRPGLPRPPIQRAGLPIRCKAIFERVDLHTSISLSPGTLSDGSMAPPIVVNFEVTRVRYEEVDEVVTAADGSYSALITKEQQEANVDDRAALLSIQATCTDESLCGMESPLTLALAPDFDTSAMDILNVPNASANGFTARLLTDGPPYGGLGAPNDLPVVAVEQFDPLRENGTEFLVWLLAGQPFDRRHRATEEIADDVCTQNVFGPCVPFRDGCRWTPACETGGDGPVVCSETNVLAPILAAGYDVWLVDQTRPDALIRETAGGLPELLDEIADLPAADPDRQLAVLGLSSGAVSSRLALGMWEAKAEVAAGAVPGLSFPSDPGAFADDPSRVALYVSFDGPHRGARVPIPLQRYLRDPDLETIDPPPDTALPEVLGSNAARELLQQFLVGADTSCFRDDDFFVRDCNLGPQALVSSAIETNRELFDALDALGELGGGPTAAENVIQTIPSIAIANSSIENGPNFSEDRLLRVTFDLGERNVVHTVRASLPQGPGSGMGNLCKAGELEGATKTVLSALQRVWVNGRCKEAGEFVPLGDYLCAVLTSPGALFVDSVNAVISLEVPMRFPTFIPNGSALLLDPPSTAPTAADLPDLWRDALWFDQPISHFAVNEEHCKFVLYHLDGQMKGDRDGFPACRNVRGSCAEGGYLPGRKLDPSGSFPANTRPFCDPDDGNSAIVPPIFPGDGGVVDPG